MGNGSTVDMIPNRNSNLNDGVQEITQIISSTRNGLQPIEEAINEAISIRSQRATDAAGF